MHLTPRPTRNAPARRPASAVIVVLVALLASGCGDWIFASSEVVPEELLVLRSTPDLAAYHFAWMAPDGSELRIQPEALDWHSVAVSPDREWVAYQSHEGGLTRMRTDGTGLVRLDAPGRAPRWSPDGSLLAIQDDETVFVMPAAGGTAVDVSSEAIADDGGCHGSDHGILRNHGFTPDGRVMFNNYICGVGNHYYSVRVDGSDSRRITEFSVKDAYWSPDGMRVVFVEFGTIYLMNADGSDRRVLEEEGRLPDRFWYSGDPWSPDGRRVAFSTGHSIVVLDVDGPGRTEIEAAGAGSGVSWSRDGRIAFTATQGDGVAVFVADPVTGVVTEVPSSPGEDFRTPFWVPAPL